MEDATQVDVDDPVELFLGHLDEAGVLRDAGVVDQHVDAAMLFLDLGDDGVDGRAVGDIHDVAFGLCTQGTALLHHGFDAGRVDVADDDDGALSSELEGGGLTDALGSAGDEADLAGQTALWGGTRRGVGHGSPPVGNVWRP